MADGSSDFPGLRQVGAGDSAFEVPYASSAAATLVVLPAAGVTRDQRQDAGRPCQPISHAIQSTGRERRTGPGEHVAQPVEPHSGSAQFPVLSA